MVIQILVEDSMAEIYEQPGVKQQVEGAVLRTLFSARDAYHERLSRTQPRGNYIGITKT